MTLPPSGGAPPPGFPSNSDFAREYFAEAVRHLGDARALHRARRYAGAIASSQKAAELAIKAAFALDGSLGWWAKLNDTHTPLTDTESHPLLKRHRQPLAQAQSTLPKAVMSLEVLAPTKKGPELDFKREVNTEYPFLFVESGSGGQPTSHFVGPRNHFDETESLQHYRTARQLLTVYRALYPAFHRQFAGLPKEL